MPYKDKEYRKYAKRTIHRNKRHPNWRQSYLDCMGMCVFKEADGGLCGDIDGLEFHEPFREAKPGVLKFQQRALLCNFHHYVEHKNGGFIGRVNPRPNRSQLQADVAYEMALYGGSDGWVMHYGLIIGVAVPCCGGYDTEEYKEEYAGKVMMREEE